MQPFRLCAGLSLTALAALPVVVHAARAAEGVAEVQARFDSALESGDTGTAQSVGASLLADFPESDAALHVLRAFHARGWKWPRLKTSFATLRRWEGDVVDDAREPDLRYALVEVIEQRFPKQDVVKDGGTLYMRQWCRYRAGRFDEAADLGREFLRRFRKSSMVDKVRWVMACCALERPKPDLDGARELLEWLRTDDASRYHDRAARRLDDVDRGRLWIDVEDGCPRAEGLGRVAVVTDLATSDPVWKALDGWRDARDATVIRFRPGRLAGIEDDLRKLGPEFVAVVVAPSTVDVNFHWEMLEICRRLDGDALPDFHFGYLTARDADDLRALAERSLVPVEGKARAQPAGIPKSAASVANLDAFVHYGHGLPQGIQNGLDAEHLAAGALPRGPVVFSGACFNGVLSRSYHDCSRLPVVKAPDEYAPEQVLSLAWVHAGARGVVAALEADRGEMAGAEWAHFRETACALGEAAGVGYRLLFTSLPETWTGFPRYEVGRSRSLALVDVMVRGQSSRLLIGDPAARPITEAGSPRSTRETATFDAAAGTLEIAVEITADADLGEAQFLFQDTLTTTGMSAAGFTERRLFGRVELPAEVATHPGRPTAALRIGERDVAVERVCVRHEVWGGRRYACVQLETADRSLPARGARATLRFRPR